MSPTPPSFPATPRSRAPGWFLVLAWIGLLAYAIVIGRNFAPVAAGADSSGYMHSARLLARGEFNRPLRLIPGFDREHPIQLTPLGFQTFASPTQLEPIYPVGLPMHLAAFYRLAGEKWGTLLVGVLAATAAVWLAYLLAREFGAHPWVAGAGALSVGLSPVLLFTSFVPLSDTLATAWFLAALYCAIRSREAWGWAVAAGLACAMTILVRPTSIVACVPLALVLWRPRNLFGAILGGLPGALWMFYYQNRLYGSPFSTGYLGFAWSFDVPSFIGTWHNYRVWLPRLMPLALLGLIPSPFLPWRQRWREFSAVYLSAAALFFFYATYDVSQQAWWYLRFVLPVLPGFIVLAVTSLDGARTRLLPAAHQAWTGVLLGLLLLALPIAVLRRWEREIHVFLLKPYQQLYLDVPAWATAHLPKNAVVATLELSGTLYFYTDFPILRWDQINPEDFSRYDAALRKEGRPLYAALLRDSVEDALTQRMPGRWEKVAEIDICTLWRRLPP